VFRFHPFNRMHDATHRKRAHYRLSVKSTGLSQNLLSDVSPTDVTDGRGKRSHRSQHCTETSTPPSTNANTESKSSLLCSSFYETTVNSHLAAARSIVLRNCGRYDVTRDTQGAAH